MLNIDRALTNSQILRSLTGLTPSQFAELIPGFSKELQRRRKAARRKRDCQRAEGGGRHHTLESDDEKLFFILMYLRVYPTMEVAGFLFSVVRSVICDWVKELLPVVEKTLGASGDLPKRKIRSVDEFLREFPEVKRVIIDSTERPRTRPKDPTKQKEHYSGKKKRHTMKNTLVVNANKKSKRILICGATVPGTRSDKRDAEGIVKNIPEHVPIDGDLGYKGLDHEYEAINLPEKKPRNGTLTDEQKQSNREFSRRRVLVEHNIGHVKRYKSVSDIYRNRRDGLDDQLMIVCCALSNFYYRNRPRVRA